MSAEPYRKRAYSADIGWRVIWRRIGLQMSFRVISHHLQIAPSTRIYKRFEETGDVTYMKQPSQPTRRRLDEYHELLLIAMVMENPCMYLQEMCNQIELVTGVQVSGATVCRVLRKNGFTKNKIQIVARQRSVEYRAYFMAQVLQLIRQETMPEITFAGLAMP